MFLKEVSYAHQECVYLFDQKYSKKRNIVKYCKTIFCFFFLSHNSSEIIMLILICWKKIISLSVFFMDSLNGKLKRTFV